MTQIFARILETGLWGGCLVGVVLVLRLVFQRAPKWVHVLFWALVGLCLIFPFPVHSPLSLRPAGGVVAAVSAPAPQAQAERRPVASIQPTARPGPDSEPQTAPGAGTAQTPAATVSQGPGLLDLCALVWVAGAAGLLVWALAGDLRLRRRVATAVRLKGNVYQSEGVSTPFVLGLLRPRIYLPFRLEPTQLAYVVAHEEAHIARKDHWWKALGFVLLAVYWFNPLLWLAYRLLGRDIEGACDEKVVRSLGAAGRADYAQALLMCSAPRRFLAAHPLAFGEGEVKQRVKRVLCYRRPAVWIGVAAVAVCVAAAAVFLTQPPEEGPVIRWDGVDYTQTGQALEELPQGSQALGTLTAEKLTGGGTDWAGSALYASGSHFNTLLLETASGYLPFVCGAGERAVKWLNYIAAPETMPWGERRETQVAQFPGVTFRWTSETLTAVSGDGEAELLTGMPIWSVWFCDLTGDGLPELCVSSSLGSGLIDQRVQVWDYAQGQGYELADRGVYDYVLSQAGGRLVVTRYPFMEHEGGETGALTLTGGVLAMVSDSGAAPEETPAPTGGVLPVNPDLDGDGQPEEVRVEVSGTGYQVRVLRQDGTQLWSARAGLDRESWNTVLLCRQGEEDFLVEYRPTRAGDKGSYRYTQISLEGGWVQQVDARQADFTLPTELTGDMASFAYLANSLLRDGLVLLSTWEGELVIGPRAAAELPRLYPVNYITQQKELPAQGAEALLEDRYPIDMVYASGAGSWGTFLTLYQGGTFEGEYTHTGMGGREVCRFTGRFGAMTAVGDYAFAMELEELHYERPVGEQWWEDGMLCTAAEAYGVAGGTRFILYLPHTPASALEENCLSWWPERLLWEDGTLDTLCAYALCNVDEGPAFFTPPFS